MGLGGCSQRRREPAPVSHRAQGGMAGPGEASSRAACSQVDELQRKVKSQQEQLFLTRQELTNTSAELKIRAIQAEGRHGQAWH